VAGAGSTGAAGSETRLEHWTPLQRGEVQVLSRSWSFPDWNTALAFVNAVGAVADAQDHHPLVELGWGRVTLFVWTHDTGGVGPLDLAFCRAVNALPVDVAPR
jgi:4a-hydroxytetrahydrobiopterin dehydratase